MSAQLLPFDEPSTPASEYEAVVAEPPFAPVNAVTATVSATAEVRRARMMTLSFGVEVRVSDSNLHRPMGKGIDVVRVDTAAVE